MVMRAMRHGALGGVMKFVLFGLLIMAVGGLVLMDVGGFFRNGGVKNSDAVKIGRESIPMASFDGTVRRTLSRIGMTPKDAFEQGYIDELLSSEIRSALMYQASNKLGVQVGTKNIAKQIHKMVEPMVQDGQTPQQVLDQILANQGMSEGQLIYSLARETSSSILTAAIQGGFANVSDNMLKDMYLYQNETRTADIAVFPDSGIKEGQKPTEEQLQKLYDTTKEVYSIPETRTVTLAFIPEQKDTVEISEDELKNIYDETIDSYSTPEQRIVEQAILKTEDEAKAILEKVKTGESLKDAAKEAYVPATPFEKEGLTTEVSNVVFEGTDTKKPLGPVKTDLGWHALIVQEIKQPTTKSFAEVRKDIETDLKQEKLADQNYELANSVDDALAGGAALDEVSNEYKLTLDTPPAFNTFGQDANGNDALKNYLESRDAILKTAFELGEGESSSVMELPDGRFAAITVKSITAKSYKPFSEIKPMLESRWIAQQRSADNRTRVMSFIAQMKTGSHTLQDIAAKNGATIKTVTLKRDAKEAPAPLTPQTMMMVFETPLDETTMVPVENGVGLAQVKSAIFPKRESIDAKQIDTLRGDYLKSVQSEAVLIYLENEREDKGVKVNRKLIESVYGPGSEAF